MSTEQDVDAELAAAELVGEREWPVTVTLKTPIDFGKEHVESLKFNRGKLGDVKDLKPEGTPTIAQLLTIASRMCGRPVALLERLTDDDSPEVLGIALSFFYRCLGAGKSF